MTVARFSTALLASVLLLSAHTSHAVKTRPQRRANPEKRLEAKAMRDLFGQDRMNNARAVRIEMARAYAKNKDILNWGKMLFPDKFPIDFCPLHEYLVSIRNYRFASTTAPRFHAKTTIQCFLIPIFQALEEPESYRHYLNIQETGLKASVVNISIRAEFETNEMLHAMYGYQVGTDKWTDSQFVLTSGVVFSALGAGQSIRGVNYRNVRPEYIMVDDLYDEEDYNSQDRTTKKNNWFWGALYPSRAVARNWSIHVSGTAVNEFDLLKELEDDKKVKTKTFRQIENYGKDDAYVLWPALNSMEEALDDKDHMKVLWFREMQNERQDSTEAKVKPGSLIPYDPADLKFDSEHILVDILMGVDPSVGANPGNDSTGIALVFRTRFKDAEPDVYNYYIDYLLEERLSMNQRVAKLLEIDASVTARGLKIGKAHIEGIAGFADFVSEVKRRTNIPVNGITSVKDKLTNLENKSVYFDNGRVFISKNIPKKLREVLEYQLTTNKPKSDDVRDALLLILPKLTIKRRQKWGPIT